MLPSIVPWDGKRGGGENSMEHLFLVNPAAGKEDPTAAVEAAAKCIAGAQNEP